MKALFYVFGVFIVVLGLVSAFDAPEWAKGAVIIAYPVTWLIVGSVISFRHRRSAQRSPQTFGGPEASPRWRPALNLMDVRTPKANWPA